MRMTDCSNNVYSLLNASQAALKTALDELDSAKKTLQWTRDKLVESQAEYRHLSKILMLYVEAPDPEDYEALLKELDKPCGFRRCELSERAAKCIRALSASNTYLADELKRQRDGADS